MRLSRANIHRRAAPFSNYHVASRPFANASFMLPCWYMALFAMGGSIGFWMLTMTKTHMKRLPQSSSSPPTQHLMQEGGEDNPLHRNKTVHGGIEYLWQLPMKKIGKTVDPEAILFLAHGCSHSMTDWWSQQSSCPDCIGLPEERAIVDIAIHKFNYLVVAVSSLDRRSKCWGEEDGPRVAAVLTELQRTVATVPIYAFGASSGGVFVSSILPEFLYETSAKRKFRGFVAQIAAPRTIFQSVPAIFITMSRDLRTERHFADLRNQYDRSLHLRVSPLSIGPTYFSDSIGSEFYSPESSRRIVEAMQLAGLLKENGRLSEDPRRSDWRTVLRPFAHHEDNLVADLSPLAEVLNVAWGMHEITRQHVEYALGELQLTLSEAFGSQYG